MYNSVFSRAFCGGLRAVVCLESFEPFNKISSHV